MLRLEKTDDLLQGLTGIELASDVDARTVYHLGAPLGRGPMATPFLARRRAVDGEAPVVVKVLRPSFVRKLGDKAAVVVRKEAVALGRLNEMVPPTPFVVRLIDTGSVHVEIDGLELELPWIAVEHVPGGALGSTLTQRVKSSIASNGYAFDATRAVHAIECISAGLAAVHEVGVIHRDLTPSHVLSTGSGPEEIFKIADFAVARPQGFSGTLAGAPVGTPGFAAPELSTMDASAVGTWTDVFSLAATIYFLLTGETLFSSRQEVMDTVTSQKRRSVLDAKHLAPEIRERVPACKSIDLVLAWATAGQPEARLTEALAVSAMIVPHLQAIDGPRSTLRSHLPPRPSALPSPEEWNWTILHQPGRTGKVFRSVGWDGYARSIAATNEGLLFWNGTSWEPIYESEAASLSGVRFVRRIGPGKWLMGGEGTTLYVYTTGGAVERVDGPRIPAGPDGKPAICEHLAGDLSDMAVLSSMGFDGVPTLHAFVSERWLKGLPLSGVAAVTGICRVDDSRWLVTGRRHEGRAYAALYDALNWSLSELEAPPDARVFLAAAGLARKAIAIACGPGGTVLSFEQGQVRHDTIEGAPTLQAAGVDPYGRPWVAGPGQVWMRDGSWRCVWRQPTWQVPMVSLFLDTGVVFAMTADGGIVEARADTWGPEYSNTIHPGHLRG